MNTAVGLSLPTYELNPDNRALIIGAGLAGCAIAGELAQRGYSCTLYDKLPSIAAATSALPVATIQPASSGDKTHSHYFTRAFEICCERLGAEIFNQCGALQLETDASKQQPKEQFSHTHAVKVNAVEASDLAGTTIKSDAWYLEHAGCVNPKALCEFLLLDSKIDFCGNTHIAAIQSGDHGWQLLSAEQQLVDESALVIIANGQGAARFAPSKHLPLQSTYGQLDLFASHTPTLKTIVHGNGYLVPASDGIWSGATHHHNPNDDIKTLIKSDTLSNRRKALAMIDALRLSDNAIQSFTGIRAATPDRLPVVGALPDEYWYRENYHDLRHGKPAHKFTAPAYHHGLYVIAAFGGRGATQALYAAELLADVISGTIQHIDVLKALHPARFLLRNLRKGLL